METARCLEEGVLETRKDADLGSIYGWGFRPGPAERSATSTPSASRPSCAEADRLAQKYGARFAAFCLAACEGCPRRRFLRLHPWSFRKHRADMRRLIFEPEHEQFRDSVTSSSSNAEVAPHGERWREQGHRGPRDLSEGRRAGPASAPGRMRNMAALGLDDFRFEQIIIEENISARLISASTSTCTPTWWRRTSRCSAV